MWYHPHFFPLYFFSHFFFKEATDAQVAVAVRKFHGIKGATKDLQGGADYMEKAAQTGEDGVALANYGYMLANGWGVEVDVAGAVQKFQRAVVLGESGGWVGLGYVHYHGLGDIAQNKTLALEYYRRAASSGDAQALFNVGEMLRLGEGTAAGVADKEAALQHFHAAAARGHFKAYYMMGLSYWFGWGATNNCADAVFLLKTVAERGPWGRVLRDAYSLYKVCILCSHKYGFLLLIVVFCCSCTRALTFENVHCKAGHRRKALILYLRAAEAGYEVAQNNVAYLLRKGMVPLGWAEGGASARAGFGGERVEAAGSEVVEAPGCAGRVGEAFLERAVMQGSSEAAVALGDIYHRRGNTSRAVYFFEVAISQGDVVYMPRAAISLGRMNEHGDGVEVNKAKAKYLYSLARRAGGEGEVAGLAAETMMEVAESVTHVMDGFSSTLASLSSWLFSWF